MSITDRSRRRVERALDRLVDEYGDVPVREESREAPPAVYESIRERFEAGTLGGAGVWAANDDGEVLLVRDAGRPGWGDPGGRHEPGETIEETARREVREETGVACELAGVVEARVVEHADASRTDTPSSGSSSCSRACPVPERPDSARARSRRSGGGTGTRTI